MRRIFDSGRLQRSAPAPQPLCTSASPIASVRFRLRSDLAGSDIPRRELKLVQDKTTTPGWDNATLVARKDLTDDSAIFRIKSDGPLFEFQAGQYVAIGLPARSPRIAGADPDEEANGHPGRRIVRAFSIASSSKARDYVELYVTLVKSGALTPRLWMLHPDDRLWLSPAAKGVFTLEGVAPDYRVVLISTRTGLAPYISMIRDHHH